MSNNPQNISPLAVRQLISDYAASKVIDWIFKDKVDHGVKSKFMWTQEDKELLKQAVLNPQFAPKDLPLHDAKFKKFFQSIIDNGLNTDDVRLFQKYKNQLPLRALGLVYDLNDFQEAGKRLVSRAKIDAGFYMLEIVIKPKLYNSSLEICLNIAGENRENETNLALFAQSDKVAKRLIKLDNEAQVALLANKHWQLNDIQHFKLAKLTKNFFLSRLYKKLGKLTRPDQFVSLKNEEIDKLWLEYNQLFVGHRGQDDAGYHHKITQMELKEIPSPTVQRNSLLKLLSRKKS